MKILYAIAVTCCFLSVSAYSQNRARAFDNFDTAGGVQVISPPIPVMVPAKSKKLIKKTGSAKMKAQDGLALKETHRVSVYPKLLMAAGSNLKGFTTGDLQVDGFILDSSKRYNIDPLLIYAQMHQESSFKLKATSYKGASGLMQLMPATARRFGVTSIYNPKQNIEGGIRYMRWLLDTFHGDVVLALAGYNAGEGAVMKYGWQVPPYRETQEYVRRITARYASISNPMLARSVRKVSSEQASRLEEKVSAPLTIYEPDALAIRLPDGKMRLINQ